ncbi:ATP-binding cassette domain-containing protein [Siminovitchia sp. FSL H7-0308]|jgi:alpha-D-ribose 1-methylphosphonate 5-triphosphate synthase subunit PhnL|uniref:Alpha-D-ribose 1-methylphosphonate 5-triphosphate synthase subunit PhnL n=1 Tax=Siminovitchia thermophila TaxID=1245522 RepID=A0ABS2R8E5_9BACI|nr:ATP-binding cassette domain-containing protein [Siminovitchia thermophila]MBM7715922.1 alpha-D-ribose 1-methylphosphonate 5-triphosphate synthase subunit PhnL [Siminovitchia thermophila]ONK21556.1 phosphonate C-P lyase system protein PhnL [Bacillus sp. VT-16-64]
MSQLLEVKSLYKSFTIHHLANNIQALNDISFTLDEGKFIGIVGKSGSGKSTILKLIYRTYLPERGEVIYNSERFGSIDLMKASEREMIYLRQYEIGYVSQFLSVMPRTTAREIVEQSVLEMGKSLDTAKVTAEEALAHFDLDPELWDNYPVTFSGGEKLRLNIASAIVKKPRLLLLDEPTASLDNDSKVKVREVLEKLKKEGTTLIGIFHDLEFMEGLCDKVYDFHKGKCVEGIKV